ncbi:galactosylceramidase [Symbioplanes lichenis]|uniref:galactosylceramidase n=1 Tax=Symbioplanes lichenis TaxID=1629072 RepID=UPI0027385CB2|nr:galactosylceramidase [Actinoplanes lichenis]
MVKLVAWALSALLATGPLVTAAPEPVQQIVVDSASGGRTFDGIGAISGGGGTSRLLVDYSEPQRSQVLDYLFEPGAGASLQILKVEIGADTNSSNGAEPSHMRSRTDLDCDRGYEWWLMTEARRRNPRMKFYGLEWGAPGWFDGGFWSADNITYLLRWLGCAKRHGLHIDYLGGWNEKGWDAAWYAELKRALLAHGYGDVKVVAADNAKWDVATDLKNDPAFYAATDVVGIHYPCSEIHCSSSQDALDLGKPLFASESGWNNYLTGAVRLAAEMNHEYVDSRITAFINWPAAYAWYPTVQMQGSGLLAANEPWTGRFELGPTLWTVAQTAQFVRPGWRYVDSASGYLDGGGTYVTLRSGSQQTTVFETTGAAGPQSVRVTPGRALHRWTTTLASTDPAGWFVRGADVRAGDPVTLDPGTVTTLTTMTGSHPVTRTPDTRVMPLPYRFDGGSRYLSDMEGAFEADRGCRCLRQVITTEPIKWSRVAAPLTLLGDHRWTDYTVSVRSRTTGTATLLGRVVNQLNNVGPGKVNTWQGYHLSLSAAGEWSLTVLDPDKSTRVLATGSVPARADHRLQLGFAGSTITARIDGARVARVTDATYGRGQVGLGLGSYAPARFDDLTIY